MMGDKATESSRKRKVIKAENESLSFYSSTDLCVSDENGIVDDVENKIEMRRQDAPGISLQRCNFLCFQNEGQRTKDLREQCFKPLTKKENREVIRAFHTSNTEMVLVSHENSNSDITGKALQCLRPGEWLNDKVINVYLELLKERQVREPQKFLKCHFFNSFFYTLLSVSKFESVNKWTTQEKLRYSLLECDKIFVPIHQTNHWTLAVINKKEKKLQYLDSLRDDDSPEQLQLTEDDSRVLDMLARYYVDEVKDKNEKDIDVSSWQREFVADFPKQKNDFDCGMFMIKYVDFYSKDIGLCFSQEEDSNGDSEFESCLRHKMNPPNQIKGKCSFVKDHLHYGWQIISLYKEFNSHSK